MKRHALFVATVLVVSFGAASLASAQSVPAQPQRATLDANGDGVIDRAEAARSPRMARAFDAMDRNGDGRIERGERPQGKAGGKRGGRGHGGIERLDTDGDGRISRPEVEQAQAARSARMAAQGKPRGGMGGAGIGGGGGGGRDMLSQFAAIDADRDGYLVRTEVRAWHERQRPQREAARAQRFDARFLAADLNRDGRLSRIEMDETMPRLGKSFAWMDDNRDGVLSRAELQAGKPHGGARR